MGVNTAAVQRLYIAYFNRPADPVGLAYWESQLSATTAATQAELEALAAQGFSPSAEYAALYAGQNNEQIVNNLYLNLFGRPAEPAGLVYWALALTNGTETFASIALQLTFSAQGTDAIAVANKETAASAFTNGLDTTDEIVGYSGTAAAESARTWLATVDDTAASLTAAAATMDAAIVDATTGGVVGSTFALTTGADNIVGTVNNDTLTGVFGGATGDTYTIADTMDGAAGTDVLALTAQGATTSPTAVTVKNFESITVRDLVGATFDATLIENSPTLAFTNTVATQTSTVTKASALSAISKTGSGNLVLNDASTASTFSMAGAGNLTVDFTTTTGTTDTAKLSLAGVGSSTASSTLDVSDTNTIEAVTIAATGSNFVTLTAGTGAKTVTITGSGTNTFDLSGTSSVGAVVTIDASASTGANTFTMGATVNTTDVIKGGTAADTVSATFGLATLTKPTLTGVETFKADFDAAAILDLSASTGLTAVTLNGSSATATVNKAAASVVTLNVTSEGAASQDVNFDYATTGALTMNIGSTASTAANITLDEVNLGGTSALTLNTVGTKVYNIDSGVDLDGDQSAIAVTANADLFISGIDVTGGDVGSFAVTVGADTSYSGGLYLDAGTMGNVTYTVAAGADAQMYLETDGGDGIGNVTMTGAGKAQIGIGVSGGGSLGNITVDLTGEGASGSYLGAIVSGGTIGNITISVADFANIDFDISGNALQFGDTDENGTDGNIGNVMVTIGDDSYVSGNINTSGGDIGNVTVNVEGTEASGNMDVHADFLSGDMDADAAADDYVRGGNIGDITLNITGVDANFNMDISASGGDVGDVNFSVTGDGASGWLGIVATAYGSGSPGGDIGDVNFTLGDNVDAEIGLNFDLTIGAITVDIGTGSSGAMYISGGSSGAAMLSDVTATMVDDGGFTLSVSGFGGDAGNAMVTAGDGNSIWLHYGSVSGSVGTNTINAGNDSWAEVNMSGGGEAGATIGDIAITLGDNSSGGVEFHYMSGGISVGNISVTVGADSNVWVANSGGFSGGFGNTTIAAGANSDVAFNFSGGNYDGIGSVTITGGDAASTADVIIWGGTQDGGFGGVDAAGWLGSINVNIATVTTGTSIAVGAGGSTVIGTEGADNIFLGAGIDNITFDTTPTAMDEIFTFAKAKDIVTFAPMTAEAAVADNAAAQAIATGTVYVIADGSNTLTVETIVSFTDLTDVAAFLNAALTGTAGGETFVAVINDGGGTAYAYNGVVTDAGIESDEIVLIGVIHADGALTTANTPF